MTRAAWVAAVTSVTIAFCGTGMTVTESTMAKREQYYYNIINLFMQND